MTTRRALLAAAPVAALGLTVQACGPARRRTRWLSPGAAVVPPCDEPAPEPHDPWRATGGRLFAPDDPREPYAPPGSWSFLSPRLRLWVPHWLRTSALVQQAETEARAAELPERPDLPPVCVIVMDPGSFSYSTDGVGQSTGLATGLWVYWSSPSDLTGWDLLYVAWRYPPGSGTLLPALGHEIGHRLTRDPCAGHPEPCQ